MALATISLYVPVSPVMRIAPSLEDIFYFSEEPEHLSAPSHYLRLK
jgi:hypothetical protein